MTHQRDVHSRPQAHSRRRPGARVLVAGIGIAVAVAAGVIMFAARRMDAPEMPVIRTVRKDVSAWIASNGKAEPREPYVSVARVNSFVRDVFVTEGAAVMPGQLLLMLDATDLRAQLAHAREELVEADEQLRVAAAGGDAETVAKLEGDLHRTDAELVKLERDRDSLRHLVEKRAATPDELAQTTLALERARAERQFLIRKRDDLQPRAASGARRATLLAERARQTILSLEAQLRSTRITAPVAGTVYSVPVRTGQHVKIGDSLAEVADLRRARVRAFIDEPELGSVEVGQTVVITWDALPGRSWTGHTESVPKSVVPRGGRSVGEVLCSIDNDDMKLLPNTNVDVRVQRQMRPRAVTVPRSAVTLDDERRYVFVVKDGRLKRQPVTVGIAGTTEYEVLQGLSEGDLVALPGEVRPREGMTIRGVVR